MTCAEADPRTCRTKLFLLLVGQCLLLRACSSQPLSTPARVRRQRGKTKLQELQDEIGLLDTDMAQIQPENGLAAEAGRASLANHNSLVKKLQMRLQEAPQAQAEETGGACSLCCREGALHDPGACCRMSQQAHGSFLGQPAACLYLGLHVAACLTLLVLRLPHTTSMQ